MATQNPYSDSLLMDALRGSLSNAESLGRGFAVAPVGLLGDVNALARQYITPRLPQSVQGLLQAAPAAPTTEQILSNIPRVSAPRRESSGMEQLGAAMNPRGPVELAKAVKNMPVGLSIKPVDDLAGLLTPARPIFDVSKRDASEIFGAGAERVMYKDPTSGGAMEVLAKPDGTASVLSLEVPEKFRGKGIGESLQAKVMQDFPSMMGQVSSKAAAKTAYRLGRRPPSMPDATLDDVYKLMDENSSVNLVSPEMQKRFVTEGGLLGQQAKSASSDLSYRGSHTAPSPEFGAPLHDLTGGGQMYPADVYSPNAAQYYGTGYPKADKEAFALANKVRGNPDAEVTMYRAVPKDEKITNINAGDWVTLSKDYAKNHGESVLGNEYKILSQKVKAKDLWTNADSIHEFGYQPQTIQKPSFTYPQEEAMRLAQQRAALPKDQGGLGLLANNTADERAAAMSGKEAIHFSRTGGDFNVLDSGQYAVAPFDAVGTHVGTKEAALDRFRNTVGTIDTPRGSTYPVQVLGDRPLMNEQGLPWGEDELNSYLRKTGGHNWSDVNGGKMTYQDMNKDLRKKLFEEQGYTSIPYVNDVEAKGVVSYIVPPDNLRSRFAAFDPFRRTAATAAAMGVAAPDLLAQEQPVITQQQIDDELAMYGLLGR